MGVRVEPLEDNILVRPVMPEERTPGGIIIPSTAQEKRSEGVVMEVGPGKIAPETGKLIEPRVAKGDRVIYSRYAGTEINVGGEDCMVLRECDLLVRVVDEA